jgi:hypothetical protein
MFWRPCHYLKRLLGALGKVGIAPRGTLPHSSQICSADDV